MNVKNIKHVLGTLILICSICYITDKLIFFTLNKISDNVYTGLAIGKLNHYLKIKESKKLLVFGSSRANLHVDPYILDTSSFNMGLNARNIAFVTTVIKLIENKKPQTLLIQIDDSTLFNEDYDGKDLDALLVKYHRNPLIKKEIDKLNKANPFLNFFWSLSYNNRIFGIILNYIKPKYDYTKYRGFDAVEPTEHEKEVFQNFVKNKKPKGCPDSVHLNKLSYNCFLELIEYAKNNNKKLIFFTAPFYDDECKIDNEELFSLTKKLNLEYFDFTDTFRYDTSLDNWRDEAHLSKIGAIKFTHKLKEELLKNSKNFPL